MTLLQNLLEPLSGNKLMICIKTDIPEEICKIDDELKAIYHSKDTVCIWVFKTREDRNKFMDDTIGMKKDDRQNYFDNFLIGIFLKKRFNKINFVK